MNKKGQGYTDEAKQTETALKDLDTDIDIDVENVSGGQDIAAVLSDIEAQARNPVVAAPDEDEDEEKEKDADKVSSTDELAAMQTQINALQQIYNQRLAELTAQQRQPAITQPEATRYLTDLDLSAIQAANDRIVVLEHQTQSMYGALKQQERGRFERAWSDVQAKYPDIEEFIPRVNGERALEAALQHGMLGTDWEAELLAVYKPKAFDKHVGRKDEVAKKRIEKQAATTAQVGKVHPGGNVFQAPVAQQPKFDRRYQHAKQQLLAELEAIGG